MDLCAHRCGDVQTLVLALARAEGTSPRVVRLAHGLTPDYVPPVPPRHLWPCLHGDEWPSQGAAAECPCDSTRPTRTTLED